MPALQLMVNRGIATFGLDYGKCPPWLFSRMVKLSVPVIELMVEEYGPDEFIRRMGNPAWFQSLGTVLAFDWNASGLTTILTAALKEAIRHRERELGIFICGGKGKTSLKTPDEIIDWGADINLGEKKTESLVYNSKMAAKVDSGLVQDGFQIYHHAFFFSKNGAWTVVQQGMNTTNASARRYHWHSADVHDLVVDPHSGIQSQSLSPTLNLAAKASTQTQAVSTELVQGSYASLMKDLEVLHKHSSELSQTLEVKDKFGNRVALLNLAKREFRNHPVQKEDFKRSPYLEKILRKVADIKPQTYEELVSLPGVGAKTLRSLALVSEIVYGAKPSYEDPARYSFAHGGKDATPYPVDTKTYDQTIGFFIKLVDKLKLADAEKKKIEAKLTKKRGFQSSVPF